MKVLLSIALALFAAPVFATNNGDDCNGRGSCAPTTQPVSNEQAQQQDQAQLQAQQQAQGQHQGQAQEANAAAVAAAAANNTNVIGVGVGVDTDVRNNVDTTDFNVNHNNASVDDSGNSFNVNHNNVDGGDVRDSGNSHNVNLNANANENVNDNSTEVDVRNNSSNTNISEGSEQQQSQNISDSGNSSSSSSATGGNQSQSSTANNAGNSQNITFAAAKTYRNTPNAGAPPIYASGICSGRSVGVGASGPGYGVSFGGTGKADRECNMREAARVLGGLGYVDTAFVLLCQQLPEVRKANGGNCDVPQEPTVPVVVDEPEEAEPVIPVVTQPVGG